MDFGFPKYIYEDFPGLNTTETINAAFHKAGKPTSVINTFYNCLL